MNSFSNSLLAHLSPLYTDLYQLKMAQGYFLKGHHKQRAVFDLHYRSNPFHGGFVIAAGLDEVAQCISQFRFRKEDLDYLKKNGFGTKFLTYLKKFKFALNIQSVREGEIVFPREPLARAEGSLLECQLIETIMINLVHFPSLIATKASRSVQVAEGRQIVEFGLRRAQGLAGIAASRAAYIGGAAATSNVLAGKMYGIPVVGTQAHSWVQAYRNELKSFVDFGRVYRKDSTFLIDTYSTLKSGLPNAIKAMNLLKKEGIRVRAVRLDSGDLAYLSKKVRKGLDEAGFPQVQIFASGNLDEHIIESLVKQNSKIDAFGVGTKLVTSYDEPAMDMVYKLSVVDNQSAIKISDTLEKMNEPGEKKIWRYLGSRGEFLLDAVLLESEKTLKQVVHPFYRLSRTPVKRLKHENLLMPLMKRGKVVRKILSVSKIRDYAAKRLSQLPEEHKRFYYPHTYRVGVSPKLFQLKEKLIESYSKKS